METSREVSYPHYAFSQHMFEDGWFEPLGYGPPKIMRSVPDSSGLYVFGICDLSHRIPRKQVNIAYIGKSLRLLKRLKRHPVWITIMRDLVDIGKSTDYFEEYSVQTWFRELPADQLSLEEKRLIKLHNPPYNIIHRRRGA